VLEAMQATSLYKMIHYNKQVHGNLPYNLQSLVQGPTLSGRECDTLLPQYQSTSKMALFQLGQTRTANASSQLQTTTPLP
jgi:hypothetical protein